MATEKKPLGPVMKMLDACLTWMRVAHEEDEEELDAFDTQARMLRSSVERLEAEAGANAPELRRLRASERDLQAALLHSQQRNHAHSEGCDACRNVVQQTTAAYAAFEQPALHLVTQ